MRGKCLQSWESDGGEDIGGEGIGAPMAQAFLEILGPRKIRFGKPFAVRRIMRFCGE